MPLLQYKGMLVGHNDWVTCISVPSTGGKNIVASGSRDKKVIIWDLDVPGSEGEVGIARCCLSKHSQPISDLVLSSRGDFVLTASWDRTLRLWDRSNRESFRTFTGHTSNVTSVAFSPDNRQIISASRDKTIKLWNTLGQCKHTLADAHQHSDWISCVRFSPDMEKPLIVSAGWDKLVKVWDITTGTLKCDLVGHLGPVQTVTISPDGSLCASGGKDGIAMLWDVNQGVHLDSLIAGSPINDLCFSPCNYWLCAATDKAIMIWDLETKKVLVDLRLIPSKAEKFVEIVDQEEKKEPVIAHIRPHPNPANYLPWCVSLTWLSDGQTLFAGGTNGNIYVFGLAPMKSE